MRHSRDPRAFSAPAAAELLREHGVRPTKARVAVLAAIRERPDHPTVERIAERLRGAGTPVKLPTLYQTLALLVRSGLLASFLDVGGLLRFDNVTQVHHHLRCVECGLIWDVLLGEQGGGALLQQAEEALAEFPGWCLKAVRAELIGVCPDCMTGTHDS